MKSSSKIFFGLFTIAFLGILLTTQIGCQKNADVQVDKSALQLKHKVTLQNGMLVFDTKEALDVTLIQLQLAGRKLVDDWEKSIGFTSHRNIFYQVIDAEDALEKTYENMPEEKKNYYRNQPQPHTDTYQKYLQDEILKVVTEKDGNQYFDYGVSMPSMASVINLEGFVKVNGIIYQYTKDAQKMILDGDFNKIEDLKRLNKNHVDKVFAVKSYSGLQVRNDLINNFSKGEDEPFKFPENKRRVKFFVLGTSEPYGNPIAHDCTTFQTCTFNLRTQAQKKNFWGNWVFSDYYPPFSLTNASWDYSYHTYPSGVGCGLSTVPHVNDIATYSCTGCSSCPCPTSPYSTFISATNNGYFALTPTGTWGSGDYFGKAFNVQYYMPANYAGFPYLIERF